MKKYSVEINKRKQNIKKLEKELVPESCICCALIAALFS